MNVHHLLVHAQLAVYGDVRAEYGIQLHGKQYPYRCTEAISIQVESCHVADG